MSFMAALSPGTSAPDFRLTDADGQAFELGRQLETGPVVLTFFKTSCPTCQYGLPYIDRLGKAIAESSASAVAICQDTPDEAERFRVEFGFESSIVFDTEEAGFRVSNAYGLTNVPTVFLIGEQGKIQHTGVSWSKSDVEEIAGRLGVPAPFRDGEDVLPFKPG